MAAPLPSSSSSSVDEIRTPPVPAPSCIVCPLPPHIIPECGSFYDDIFVPPPASPRPPSIVSDMQEMRGRSRSRSPRRRSRSRSRSPSPSLGFIPGPFYGNSYIPVPPPIIYDYTPPRSRSCSPISRSPSPVHRRRRRCYRRSSRSSSRRRRSYSPAPPIIIHAPPSVTVPSPLLAPSPMWAPPPAPAPEPVDILTFHYNKNMAYAPAAKSYDGAIENVLELWPELRDTDRDRIQLFVGCSDQLVRVPKMAWELVLCDFPRYEVVHVQVDQPPPPPQYQGDGKGNWASGDEKKEKQPRSRGFFASVKRIFWR